MVPVEWWHHAGRFEVESCQGRSGRKTNHSTSKWQWIEISDFPKNCWNNSSWKPGVHGCLWRLRLWLFLSEDLATRSSTSAAWVWERCLKAWNQIQKLDIYHLSNSSVDNYRYYYQTVQYAYLNTRIAAPPKHRKVKSCQNSDQFSPSIFCGISVYYIYKDTYINEELSAKGFG